jgi:hypothetical protein
MLMMFRNMAEGQKQLCQAHRLDREPGATRRSAALCGPLSKRAGAA